MEEKIKVYVDSNEKGFITDCYLADNTKIICEFYHEESEIEYSNCKLLNLQEYDKQKDQRIAELEQDRDTWKRACELASSHISWCPAKQGECNCAEEKRDCTNFFYQQAKKEGNDE